MTRRCRVAACITLTGARSTSLRPLRCTAESRDAALSRILAPTLLRCHTRLLRRISVPNLQSWCPKKQLEYTTAELQALPCRPRCSFTLLQFVSRSARIEQPP